MLHSLGLWLTAEGKPDVTLVDETRMEKFEGVGKK